MCTQCFTVFDHEPLICLRCASTSFREVPKRGGKEIANLKSKYDEACKLCAKEMMILRENGELKALVEEVFPQVEASYFGSLSSPPKFDQGKWINKAREALKGKK